jgi:dihydropyrimidine dehydrogenase (NADP+)/dihydropyrimidine dehydrogenase (NAD+) subunit PreA
MGVNLDTLRPEPTVEGYSTAGGYSSQAIRPIALRMVMEIATMMRREFPARSLSGLGGIETGGDAAQFILLGADTVQVCTGVMKHGYACVKPMQEELLRFMARHHFETPADFKGKSLEFITTHADLVRRQMERKAGPVGMKDGDWKGEELVRQAEGL